MRGRAVPTTVWSRAPRKRVSRMAPMTAQRARAEMPDGPASPPPVVTSASSWLVVVAIAPDSEASLLVGAGLHRVQVGQDRVELGGILHVAVHGPPEGVLHSAGHQIAGIEPGRPCRDHHLADAPGDVVGVVAGRYLLVGRDGATPLDPDRLRLGRGQVLDQLPRLVGPLEHSEEVAG